MATPSQNSHAGPAGRPLTSKPDGPDIEKALSSVEDIERQKVPQDTEVEVFDYPFEEIRSLVWAKNDPVYRVALEEWERKERLSSGREERREKSSADLINQIFNLVGYFSGFLGLVLTAVAQLMSASSCKSLCRKVWFPILLTVAAATVTIIGILQKFSVLKELEDFIKIEKQAHTEATRRGAIIRRHGPNFRFYDLKDLESRPPRSFSWWKWGVIAALVVFTAIFILSYWVILCD